MRVNADRSYNQSKEGSDWNESLHEKLIDLLGS